MGTVRVSSFGVLQTAKMSAVLYFCISLIFVPFILLGAIFGPGHGMSWLFAIFFPFLYAAAGFVFTAIACFIYNLLAGAIGGIEFTISDAK